MQEFLALLAVQLVVLLAETLIRHAFERLRSSPIPLIPIVHGRAP